MYGRLRVPLFLESISLYSKRKMLMEEVHTLGREYRMLSEQRSALGKRGRKHLREVEAKLKECVRQILLPISLYTRRLDFLRSQTREVYQPHEYLRFEQRYDPRKIIASFKMPPGIQAIVEELARIKQGRTMLKGRMSDKALEVREDILHGIVVEWSRETFGREYLKSLSPTKHRLIMADAWMVHVLEN